MEKKNTELKISFCVAAQSVFVAIQTVWEKREDGPTLLQLSEQISSFLKYWNQ